VTRSTSAGVGSNSRSTATAVTRTTRSTPPGGPCTPAPTLLTDKQKDRLTALFAAEEQVEVEATWGMYQRMIAAYRHPDRTKGRELMQNLIGSVGAGVPAALSEVITLGRTLKKRAVDVLAYFDRPGTSNGPTEAINGRLEHLRGSALGFRNLTNYIARSLLETGGFRPLLHPGL
jgi:transposase